MGITTPNAETVARDVEMRILLDNGTSVPMPCTLCYTLQDPFAVSASFRSSEGSVTWVFGRELLKAGTRTSAGEGDIRISPRHAASRSMLHLELSSPSGQAIMEGPLASVTDFLDATYELLPEGYEWQYLNFDTALAELLNGDVA